MGDRRHQPTQIFRSTDRSTYQGLTYDPLFQQYDHGPTAYAAALVEFLGSAAVHSVTDPLTAAPPGTRGFFDPFDTLRWRAGMVAQLAVESALRKALRDKLVAALNEFQPDILAAHSLGTLITYDLFRNDPRGRDILANGVYITFGSQINNPFARSRLFPGQIEVPNVRFGTICLIPRIRSSQHLSRSVTASSCRCRPLLLLVIRRQRPIQAQAI